MQKPKRVAKTTEDASLPELLNRLELALPEILERASVGKALADLTNRLNSVDGKRPEEPADPRLRDVGTRSSSNPYRCFLNAAECDDSGRVKGPWLVRHRSAFGWLRQVEVYCFRVDHIKTVTDRTSKYRADAPLQ